MERLAQGLVMALPGRAPGGQAQEWRELVTSDANRQLTQVLQQNT